MQPCSTCGKDATQAFVPVPKYRVYALDESGEVDYSRELEEIDDDTEDTEGTQYYCDDCAMN